MGIVILEERFTYKVYVNRRRPISKAQCSCGIIFYPFLENITRGLTTGCAACQNIRHGGSKTKLYKVWKDRQEYMKYYNKMYNEKRRQQKTKGE